MLPSILNFTFYLVLRSFLSFLGSIGLFWRSGGGQKTVLGSTHVSKQISFALFPSILTLDYSLNLGLFFTFWGYKGFYWGQGRVQELFGGLLI